MIGIKPSSLRVPNFSRNFCAVSRTTTPAKRNWDPNEIYPSEPGQVRITGNTIRDGHQSLNGGLHRIDLHTQAAELIEKIRPPGMIYPGSEEIGGGTTIDFPLRFKGENPWRNMEMISSRMPNVPLSALIRSDSLCGYTVSPRDVARAFIKRYGECGIDIFRNFDAYNNIANHATIAQAVLDAGKHYQAAIVFTSHPDPTLYNVKWAGDLVKGFRDLGAHSICIKDMAGIASPALMKAWCSEIKSAVPELPLVIHSHYTTGFAPITYMQAIEGGANAIDCAISTLSGRSGHPSMEVFTKVLSEMGYDLGFDVDKAQEAMKDVAELYRQYHPHYEFCEMKMAGTVDYRVFEKGIPGGQISIFRNELIRNNMGHLFETVMDQIQTVRKEVGGVALVTPTADHVARQSTANAQDGLSQTGETSRLWPGYSEMLRGYLGKPLEPQDEKLQQMALLQWTQETLKNMDLNDDVKAELKAEIPEMVDIMWERVQPIMKKQRVQDLRDRIRHLNEIDNVKFSDRIAEAQAEIDELAVVVDSMESNAEERYEDFLATCPSNRDRDELISSFDGRAFAINLKRGFLNMDQFLELVKAACYCTICPSSVMPDGLERCKDEVEALSWEHDFELPPRESSEMLEWAILQSMFRSSQNIALNYFRYGKEKPEHWAPNPYPPQAELDSKARAPPLKVAPVMFPYVTKTTSIQPMVQTFSDAELQRVLGHEISQLNEMKAQLEEQRNAVPETAIREKNRDRKIEKLEHKIGILSGEIQDTLFTILNNCKSEEAGVYLLKDDSLEQLQARVGC